MDPTSRRIMLDRLKASFAEQSASVGDLRRMVDCCDEPIPPRLAVEVLDVVARVAVAELVELDDLLTGVALVALEREAEGAGDRDPDQGR